MAKVEYQPYLPGFLMKFPVEGLNSNSSPSAVMKDVAKKMLVRIDSPLVEIEALATNYGLIISDMSQFCAGAGIYGLLLPRDDLLPGYYLAEINRSLEVATQRFTVAHELGHAVVLNLRANGLMSSILPKEEEDLCDDFANHILNY